MILLHCDRLSVAYDDTVLEDISFSIEAGDFICVVGENGSGKTTLIKALLGLLPLKSGNVVFKEGLQCGYVPQKLSIKRDFPASAEEIVRMGVRSSRPFLSKSEKETVRRNMQLLGIDSLRKKSFESLSGGQQQRVLIARALTASESLLILDEPATGLDPMALSDLYTLLKDLNRTKGTTVLMVSHDIPATVTVATKILHINKTIQFFGPPEDFVCSECGKRFMGGESDA